MNRRTKLPRVVCRIDFGRMLVATRARADRGSTLVEILVAMGIVAVALAVFISMLQTGVLTVGSVQDQTVASALARSQMEVVKSAAWPGPYPVVAIPPGYSVTVSSDPGPSPELQLVTVRVLRAGRTVVTLQGYKANR
jgi:prepilin-type N-terminal cleavage/methylation domain-containing protein